MKSCFGGFWRAGSVFVACAFVSAIGFFTLSAAIAPPTAIGLFGVGLALPMLGWLFVRERTRAQRLERELLQHRCSEEQLRESEICMRAVADAVPALIAYIDSNLRLRLGNRTYQRWFGKPLAQLEGLRAPELLGPRSWAIVKPYMERALQGETLTYEEELLYPDGPRWVRVSYTPDRAADGKVRGLVVFVTDIGERKRVEYAVHRAAERSRQLHLITAALSGTMIAEHVARVILEHVVVALDTDAAWVGLRGPDGRLAVVCAHGSDRDPELTVAVGSSPCADAAITRAPVYLRTPDERAERYPQLASPFEHGPPRASVCLPLLIGDQVLGVLELFWSKPMTFRDEDHYFLNALARESAQALERARLYAAAQQARAQAEASDNAKDRFIAVLSHELRTPLTPVLTAAQMLENGQSTQCPQVRTLAALIRRNAELEARLIDDLLDLTRISRGKLSLHIENVDAHAKVREVLRACETELEAKRLQVETRLEAGEHYVRADQARFQQVIWNLVKNAVKFSHPEGRVTVLTRAGDDGQLVLEVRDEGVGIEAELLPRLFNAFEQGSREVTRHFGGLGLGLAVSKALVEAQGGSITAASPGKNRGSTFVVSIPRAQVVAPASAASAATDGTPMEEAHRILLVEDHEDTSEILAEFLETRGYRVKIADTVASALRIADAETFDLVLSDLGLPDGTGYDLMRQLQARHHLRGVALSGYGRDKDVEEAKAAGFLEHVTKPPNPEHLLKVLSRVLV